MENYEMRKTKAASRSRQERPPPFDLGTARETAALVASDSLADLLPWSSLNEVVRTVDHWSLPGSARSLAALLL